MLNRQNNQNKGKWAESVVLQALRAEGHQIEGKNWRIMGTEYDLISLKDSVLFITEVKYRKQESLGRPEIVSDQQFRSQLNGFEILLEMFNTSSEACLQLAVVTGNSRSYRIEYFTDISPVVG